MRLTNTTAYPTHFLRRMVAWCCRELELPPRQVKRVHFGKRSNGWRGTAWYEEILVRIGPTAYPTRSKYTAQRGAVVFEMHDELETLVNITAHELAHVRQNHLRGVPKAREIDIDAHSHTVLLAFRAERERLLAEWSAPPRERTKAPAKSRRERNESKARAALERWQRKLKLAQTKVRKYKTAVRRYERLQAATAPAKEQP